MVLLDSPWLDSHFQTIECDQSVSVSSGSRRSKEYGRGTSRVTLYWSILPKCSFSKRTTKLPWKLAFFGKWPKNSQKFHCQRRSISKNPAMKSRKYVSGVEPEGMKITQMNRIKTLDIYRAVSERRSDIPNYERLLSQNNKPTQLVYGVLFRLELWSLPVCSPYRATLRGGKDTSHEVEGWTSPSRNPERGVTKSRKHMEPDVPMQKHTVSR